MTCFLQYTKSGDEEFLEGNYTSMNVRDSSNCGRGTVFLHKVPASDFYTEPFVAKREKEIADADSLNNSEKTAIHRPATKPAKPNVTGTPTHKPATAAKPPATADIKKPGTAGANPPVKNPHATAKINPPATHSGTPPAHKPATTVKPAEPEHRQSTIARATVPRETVSQDSGATGLGRKFPTIAPPALTERENKVVKTLVVHTNEVTLNIYDDGAIDHDTVSVYVDNKQVLNHAMLTDKPLIVTIHLDETNNYHEVVMVAENEGEIPPNTSLMIVKAGDKEYEVRITSTEQKNAVVRFQYSK
jgi:hypothetical protein